MPIGRFGPVRRVPLTDVVYEDRWDQPYSDPKCPVFIAETTAWSAIGSTSERSSCPSVTAAILSD